MYILCLRTFVVYLFHNPAVFGIWDPAQRHSFYRLKTRDLTLSTLVSSVHLHLPFLFFLPSLSLPQAFLLLRIQMLKCSPWHFLNKNPSHECPQVLTSKDAWNSLTPVSFDRTSIKLHFFDIHVPLRFFGMYFTFDRLFFGKFSTKCLCTERGLIKPWLEAWENRRARKEKNEFEIFFSFNNSRELSRHALVPSFYACSNFASKLSSDPFFLSDLPR